MNETNGFMRRDQAAKYLGVSSRTLSDWQRRRIIPYVKMGRKCVLFRREDLVRAMEKFIVRSVGV